MESPTQWRSHKRAKKTSNPFQPSFLERLTHKKAQALKHVLDLTCKLEGLGHIILLDDLQVLPI